MIRDRSITGIGGHETMNPWTRTHEPSSNRRNRTHEGSDAGKMVDQVKRKIQPMAKESQLSMVDVNQMNGKRGGKGW